MHIDVADVVGSIKDELLSLEARKAELQSRLEAPEMPELLHPRTSDVYRDEVGNLCLALESERGSSCFLVALYTRHYRAAAA